MRLSELPREAQQRIGRLRKVATWERVTKGKRILPFGTNQQLTLNEGKKLHGRQNKHHGRKPGSYKHRRDIVRNSRRRNRA